MIINCWKLQVQRKSFVNFGLTNFLVFFTHLLMCLLIFGTLHSYLSFALDLNIKCNLYFIAVQLFNWTQRGQLWISLIWKQINVAKIIPAWTCKFIKWNIFFLFEDDLVIMDRSSNKSFGFWWINLKLVLNMSCLLSVAVSTYTCL